MRQFKFTSSPGCSHWGPRHSLPRTLAHSLGSSLRCPGLSLRRCTTSFSTRRWYKLYDIVALSTLTVTSGLPEWKQIGFQVLKTPNGMYLKRGECSVVWYNEIWPLYFIFWETETSAITSNPLNLQEMDGSLPHPFELVPASYRINICVYAWLCEVHSRVRLAEGQGPLVSSLMIDRHVWATGGWSTHQNTGINSDANTYWYEIIVKWLEGCVWYHKIFLHFVDYLWPTFMLTRYEKIYPFAVVHVCPRNDCWFAILTCISIPERICKWDMDVMKVIIWWRVWYRLIMCCMCFHDMYSHCQVNI